MVLGWVIGWVVEKRLVCCLRLRYVVTVANGTLRIRFGAGSTQRLGDTAKVHTLRGLSKSILFSITIVL